MCARGLSYIHRTSILWCELHRHSSSSLAIIPQSRQWRSPNPHHLSSSPLFLMAPTQAAYPGSLAISSATSGSDKPKNKTRRQFNCPYAN
jgi:hypothetical protein